MRELAKDFGISDVALAKRFRRLATIGLPRPSNTICAASTISGPIPSPGFRIASVAAVDVIRCSQRCNTTLTPAGSAIIALLMRKVSKKHLAGCHLL